MSATPFLANQLSLTATVVTASTSSPAEQTLTFVERQPVKMPPYHALQSQVASDLGVSLSQTPTSVDLVFDIIAVAQSFALTIASTSSSEASSQTRMHRSGTRASTLSSSKATASTSDNKSPHECRGGPTTRSRTRKSPTSSLGASLPLVPEHDL